MDEHVIERIVRRIEFDPDSPIGQYIRAVLPMKEDDAMDDVEHGWRVDIGMDGKRLIVTPGGHVAAWSENESDAQLIVGELNHVAELRDLVAAHEEQQKFRAEKIRELAQGEYSGPLERMEALERRVAALEAIIAGQN